AIGADGTVYAGVASASPGTTQTFAAIDPSDGTVRWSVSNMGIGSNPAGFSVPAIGAKGIIYTSTGGDLRALHADKSMAWHFTEGSASAVPSGPAIDAKERVYVVGTTTLDAVDDGKLAWRYAALTGADGSAPTVAPDGTVYVSAQGGVFAL